MPDDGSTLEALASSFAPLASGTPFQPHFGFEGTPLQQYPLAGMFLQPMLSGMMGRMGMAPLGLSDRNIYDTLKNQRIFKQMQQLQQQAAQSDRDNWMRTMRGMAHATGTPWGADQMTAAGNIADTAVSMSPLLTMIAPDLVDEMSGYRGSAAVMAGRMMDAGRYRFDPVTGRMGQDPTQVAAQSKKLYEDFFVNGGLKDNQGFAAGDMGQLYQQLSQRGLLAGSTQTPFQAMGRLDFNTMSRAATNAGFTLPINTGALTPGQRDQLNAAARQNGFSLPQDTSTLSPQQQGVLTSAARQGGFNLTADTTRMTGEQIDKLGQDSQVGESLRSIDTDKVKKSLSGYLQAINAVRDIFGDMGRPNAPMAELVGALQGMTNGSMSQIQPGQLNMMVRMTQQLAQSTGVGLDNALMVQQGTSQFAQRLGIEPVFAVGATQHALAYGGAYRAQGLSPAWGALSPDEMTQLDAKLTTSAAASRAAQRAGVALRISDELGTDGRPAFDANSDAGRYVAALKSAQETGNNTWIDSQGQSRALNLNQGEFNSVITANGRVNTGDIETMMNQRAANREYIQKYGVADTIRASQGRTDAEPWLRANLSGFLQGALARGTKVDGNTARNAIGATAQSMVEAIRAIDPEKFRNTQDRTTAIQEILAGSIGGTDAGKQLVAQLGTQGASDFYRRSAEQFYGQWDELSRNSPDFHMSAQAWQSSFSDRTMQQATRIQQEERMTATIRTAMAPLNRGSMLRRAMGYVQGLKEGSGADNEVIWRGIGEAIGGVSSSEIQAQLGEPLQTIKKQQEELENRKTAILNETDPKRRADLQNQFNDQLQRLDSSVSLARDTFGRLGASDDMLTTGDTNLAMSLRGRTTDYTANATSMLSGLSPGDAQQKYSEFIKTKGGQLYEETTRNYGNAATDVAAKLLNSPATIQRLGLQGIEQAKQINDSNNEILRMAASYTDGNVAKLAAGVLDPSLSDAERRRVMSRYTEVSSQQNAAVENISTMQRTSGVNWGDHKTLADKLGLSVEQVDRASHMDFPTIEKINRATELKAQIDREMTDNPQSGALPLLRKQLEEAQTSAVDMFDKANPELDRMYGKPSFDSLKSANVVYDKFKEQAAEAGRMGATPPQDLAKQLMEKLGLNYDDQSEAGQQQLNDFGALLKTQAGQAMIGGRTGLLEGQATMASYADRAGIKGTVSQKFDAIYGDYSQLGGLTGDARTKAESAFRKKYGVKSDAEFGEIERGMAMQTATDMYEWGEAGSDHSQRVKGTSGSKAIELLSKEIQTGKMSGSQSVNIGNWPDKVTVEGNMTVKGDAASVSGTAKPGVSAAGMNHVPSGS